MFNNMSFCSYITDAIISPIVGAIVGAVIGAVIERKKCKKSISKILAFILFSDNIHESIKDYITSSSNNKNNKGENKMQKLSTLIDVNQYQEFFEKNEFIEICNLRDGVLNQTREREYLIDEEEQNKINNSLNKFDVIIQKKRSKILN